MKSSAMFNFDYLFGDHMAQVSDQAKLYYIKLCFFANCGFVSNPISVADSMGYDKSVIDELIGIGELLKLPDRAEVFITAYFVHNHFNASAWTHTPYYPYWKGKLWTKKNGVATFKKPEEEEQNESIRIVDGTILDNRNRIDDNQTDKDITFQEMFGVKYWTDLTKEQQKQWWAYVESTKKGL